MTAVDAATVVATHTRSLHKGSEDLVLDHYLEVLGRKPGALAEAIALVSARAPRAGQADPSGAERWAGYLDWVREDIIKVVTSLSQAEQRTSRLPSGWTPIELLSHVFHMGQRWFVWGFLGGGPALG